MVGCCEHGDEHPGCGDTQLVIQCVELRAAADVRTPATSRHATSVEASFNASLTSTLMEAGGKPRPHVTFWVTFGKRVELELIISPHFLYVCSVQISRLSRNLASKLCSWRQHQFRNF
jgi:hypothetical protein